MRWFTRAVSTPLGWMAVAYLISAPALPDEIPVDSFLLRDIALEDSTVIDEDHLNTLAKPLINTWVTVEDLNHLRHQLNEVYMRAGYVSSGVVIPDQQITSGTVRFVAREGALTEIRIDEETHLNPNYIRTVLSKRIEKPLKLDDLQLALLELERDPLISRVEASLTAGDRVGGSLLDLSIDETSPASLGLRVDNYRPPSIGENQASLTYLNSNLSGRADVLSAAIGASEGDLQGDLGYRLPILPLRSSLSFFLRANESEVVTAPFRDIDVESNTDTWGVLFNHTAMERPGSRLNLSIGFEQKHSETSLLGWPFSFSVGAENGESNASILAVGAEYLQESSSQVSAFRIVGRFGLDAFGATSIPDAPDGEFSSLIVQGQIARRFESNRWLEAHPLEMRARFDLQKTRDALQSFEKFGIGGVRTVRGYTETALLKDNAFVASIEALVPLVPDSMVWSVDLMVFADYGRGWDNLKLSSAPRGDQIASVGGGFSCDTVLGLRGEMYYGKTLNRRDLAHDGVHFALSYVYSL